MKIIDQLVCPVCLFCSSPIFPEENLCEGDFPIACENCLDRLGWPDPLTKFSDERVGLADKVIYIWEYDKVKDVIHKLKFGGDFRVRYLVANLIKDFVIDNKELFESSEMVSFVPMHWFKFLFFRPIDLAHWTANLLSQVLSLDVVPLFTVSFFKPTLHCLKNGRDRRSAIKNVFALSRTVPSNVKGILLVDDILTTGSTFSELCWMIRRIKPEVKITVFSLCG